jgi:drug/metabolite transporter (DMT)-like permease
VHYEDTARNRLIGIGILSGTFVFFAVLDTGAKWLVRTLPVVEVVWLRFLAHVLFTGALLAPRHGLALVRTRRPGLQLLRAGLLPTMTALNFWALQYLQLAETGAIQFTVPILIALFAAPLLGERLDGTRWAAIVAGFLGVLIIVRPGTQGFHPALLLSLANAVLYAIFNLATRSLAAWATGCSRWRTVTPRRRCGRRSCTSRSSTWRCPATWCSATCRTPRWWSAARS